MSAAGGGLLTFILASLLVIGLAFGASRLLANWQVASSRGRRLRVIEGVPVGKDRHVLLVAVGKEVLVLGSSTQGVSLVHQVTDPETVAELLAVPEPQSQSQKLFTIPGLSGLPGLPGRTGAGPGVASAEESVRSSLDRMRLLLNRAGGGTDA